MNIKVTAITESKKIYYIRNKFGRTLVNSEFCSGDTWSLFILQTGSSTLARQNPQVSNNSVVFILRQNTLSRSVYSWANV